MSVVARSRAAWAAALAALIVAALVLGLGRHSTHSAAAATDTSPDTITVSGVGTANGKPDTLSVDFTVHVTRGSVQSALDAQSAATNRLLDSLDKAGVSHKDTQTTDLSLDRHYNNHGEVTGYDASQTVRAKITPLSKAGKAISAGATASGDDISVGALSFDIAHDDALVAQARSAAFADAEARAQQYAGLTDRSLGRVEKISETISDPNPQPVYYDQAFAKASAGSAAVPLRGGQQTLTVHVKVIFELT